MPEYANVCLLVVSYSNTYVKMNIYRSFIVLIWLGFERGDAQSLSCGQSAGVPTLGLPFELYCTLSGQVTAYYGVSLKKANVSFMQIPFFESNSNATYFNDGLSGRHSTVVSVTPGVSRTVTVKFSTLECIDNSVYNWEITIYISEFTTLREQKPLILKVIPLFGSDDLKNITYTPATNLAEGDSITFTCEGDVGNTPVGQLSWFYYLNGSSTAVDVSSTSDPKSPQDSTVAGRKCSKTRVSTLTLTLTKAMHWFVVRCTVNQDQPFNPLGQGYKITQQIDVMYKPTISSLVKVPDANQYTEGDPLLTLTCTATSNPAPTYYWVYESEYTNRTQIGAGNQLVLRNLTLNTTGTYTCVAYNLIKGVNQTVNASRLVAVVERTTARPSSEESTPPNQVYGPRIISLTRDPNYDVYDEDLEMLTLTCVASGNPLPSFMWIFQSGNADKEHVGHGNQLVLRRLTIQHTGFYTCFVYNTINGNNQSTYSSVLVHVERSRQPTSQTKQNDATVISATFGITVAALAIILAIVFAVIRRRYKCFKKQESDTRRNNGSPASVECDEYQTTPYYSIPRMYETLERTPNANEAYTQLESAGGPL